MCVYRCSCHVSLIRFVHDRPRLVAKEVEQVSQSGHPIPIPIAIAIAIAIAIIIAITIAIVTKIKVMSISLLGC